MDAAWESTLTEKLQWPLRPIATSLNGDNSWLLSFPRPPTDFANGRLYYHVVFEPWLDGPALTWNAWLVHMVLSQSPAFATPADIEKVAEKFESVARTKAESNGQIVPLQQKPDSTEDDQDNYHGIIDAILLGFHYSDHLHDITLKSFDSRIPVVATKEAAALVQPWNHFQTISLISDFESTMNTWNSQDLHLDALPPWLTVLHLSGHHELNFVTVIVWSHQSEGGDTIHETLMQSPHGYPRQQEPLNAFLRSQPPTQSLAMLHGLKESRAAGSMTTFGATAGLEMYRKLGGVRHWLISHDDTLSYSGLVMRLFHVHDTWRTLEWAMQNEKREADDGKDATKPNLVQVANGKFLVLD